MNCVLKECIILPNWEGRKREGRVSFRVMVALELDKMRRS